MHNMEFICKLNSDRNSTIALGTNSSSTTILKMI